MICRTLNLVAWPIADAQTSRPTQRADAGSSPRHYPTSLRLGTNNQYNFARAWAMLSRLARFFMLRAIKAVFKCFFFGLRTVAFPLLLCISLSTHARRLMPGGTGPKFLIVGGLLGSTQSNCCISSVCWFTHEM